MLAFVSESRTAGMAYLLGMLSAASIITLITKRKLSSNFPGLRSRRVLFLLTAAMAGLVVAGPALSERMMHYITKSGRAEVSGLAEAYDRSRGSLIEEMLDNIKDRPFVGIGFGIASDPQSMKIDRDPVLGLPTGASIEKGVMPLAVLEELGVVGFLLVAAWIWMLLKRAAFRGLAALSVLLVALFVNLGESILFSPGGQGMLILILLAWATARPKEKLAQTSALHIQAER